jgi:hypothetical protein
MKSRTNGYGLAVLLKSARSTWFNNVNRYYGVAALGRPGASTITLARINQSSSHGNRGA